MKYQPSYLEMVSYKRPQGSRAQSKFCNRFLRPVFGVPDEFGNYTLTVMDGEKHPKIAFMAHHDTVHRQGGRQTPIVDGEFVRIASDCLGADCTTGVYIILRMIDAQVPGVYVVHAAEEIGCVGSRALVKSLPEWIGKVKAAISFDRKGYNSIITHQIGSRTCSDKFADSLSEVLDLGFEKDDTGVYTDSNEYTDVIGECTNISVGYFSQHSAKETQDVVFMERLISSLISSNWDELVFDREPGDYDLDDKFSQVGSKYAGNTYGSYGDDLWYEEYGAPEGGGKKYTKSYEADSDKEDILVMRDVIGAYQDEIAEILISYGYNASGLLDDAEDVAIKHNRRIGRLIGAY